MKFPEWAPQELCDLFNKGNLLKDEKALLERMLTYQDMKPVWKAFREADEKLSESERKQTQKIFGSWPDKGFDLILEVYKEACKDHLKKSELIEKYTDIAEKAKGLARALNHQCIDLSYTPWFDEPRVKMILLAYCGPNKVEDIFKDIKSACLRVHPDLSPGDELPQCGIGRQPYQEILKDLQNEAGDRIQLLQGKLDYEDYSSDQLDELMLCSPLVQHPGAKNAKANWFIRAMGIEFKVTFGQYRYRLLAKLASVVMDDPNIDESQVRSTLRQFENMKKKSHPMIASML